MSGFALLGALGGVAQGGQMVVNQMYKQEDEDKRFARQQAADDTRFNRQQAIEQWRMEQQQIYKAKERATEREEKLAALKRAGSTYGKNLDGTVDEDVPAKSAAEPAQQPQQIIGGPSQTDAGAGRGFVNPPVVGKAYPTEATMKGEALPAAMSGGKTGADAPMHRARMEIDLAAIDSELARKPKGETLSILQGERAKTMAQLSMLDKAGVTRAATIAEPVAPPRGTGFASTGVVEAPPPGDALRESVQTKRTRKMTEDEAAAQTRRQLAASDPEAALAFDTLDAPRAKARAEARAERKQDSLEEYNAARVENETRRIEAMEKKASAEGKKLTDVISSQARIGMQGRYEILNNNVKEAEKALAALVKTTGIPKPTDPEYAEYQEQKESIRTMKNQRDRQGEALDALITGESPTVAMARTRTETSAPAAPARSDNRPTPTAAASAPAGYTKVGRTPDGRTVWRDPSGKQVIQK